MKALGLFGEAPGLGCFGRLRSGFSRFAGISGSGSLLSSPPADPSTNVSSMRTP
jgi:hypothetical protein